MLCGITEVDCLVTVVACSTHLCYTNALISPNLAVGQVRFNNVTQALLLCLGGQELICRYSGSKARSKQKKSPAGDSSIMQRCLEVIEQLLEEEDAEPFAEPVTPYTGCSRKL